MTALPLTPAALANPLELRAVPRPSAATAEQARKVGMEFEGLFLAQMLAPMFEGLGTDGLFGGGAGERMFRSLQIDEYAKAVARKGGIGIADAVTREILMLQEKAHG